MTTAPNTQPPSEDAVHQAKLRVLQAESKVSKAERALALAEVELKVARNLLERLQSGGTDES